MSSGLGGQLLPHLQLPSLGLGERKGPGKQGQVDCCHGNTQAAPLKVFLLWKETAGQTVLLQLGVPWRAEKQTLNSTLLQSLGDLQNLSLQSHSAAGPLPLRNQSYLRSPPLSEPFLPTVQDFTFMEHAHMVMGFDSPQAE